MTEVEGGRIDQFMQRMRWAEIEEQRTLDPLEFDSYRFPSFEEYTSFPAGPAKDASNLAFLHSSKDADVAALVAALVRRAADKGWRISYPCDDAGRADVFLLLLSQESAGSSQMLNAFARALSYKVPVLPCLFGPLTASALPEHYGWFQSCRLDVAEEISALLNVMAVGSQKPLIL